MQSYPQQEYYRKVVLKACQSNVKSYSVFSDGEAGILHAQGKEKEVSKVTSEGTPRLMSE
jgi:hypothetical protein